METLQILAENVVGLVHQKKSMISTVYKYVVNSTLSVRFIRYTWCDPKQELCHKVYFYDAYNV